MKHNFSENLHRHLAASSLSGELFSTFALARRFRICSCSQLVGIGEMRLNGTLTVVMVAVHLSWKDQIESVRKTLAYG